MSTVNRSEPAQDEATRVRLGAATATPADVMIDLAGDSSVTVRAALALNHAAPAEVNQTLAADRDECVRILLARKLAALVPSLSPTEHALLHQETWRTLRALVEDEATRVRAIIADAVKELPDAPHDLILRLARDADLSVSEPIIRLSPLLTNQDLLALVVMPPAAGTVAAVARRASLDPDVTDAIAASTDSAGIRALLANPSAQIRDATLDALVARSVDHPDWHEPLVRRPSLPPRTARKLSEIVATHLLTELVKRADLAPPLAKELWQRIATHLAPVPAPSAPMEAGTDEAIMQARCMAMRGELNEEAVLQAARHGDACYAAALLAVAAGSPVSVVNRAASLRSAKGVVSLVWKAGFTMRAAIALQTLLARLAPDAVLIAGPGGSFPLAVEEMRWQLDFLGRMGR
jgi:uncharacterized protein (DUF2336 family)